MLFVHNLRFWKWCREKFFQKYLTFKSYYCNIYAIANLTYVVEKQFFRRLPEEGQKKEQIAVSGEKEQDRKERKAYGGLHGGSRAKQKGTRREHP